MTQQELEEFEVVKKQFDNAFLKLEQLGAERKKIISDYIKELEEKKILSLRDSLNV